MYKSMYKNTSENTYKNLIRRRYMFFIKQYKNITGISLNSVKFNPIVDERYCDFNTFYKDVSRLGVGFYGTVVKAVFKDNDTVPLAVKVVVYNNSYISEVQILEALFHLIKRKNTPHITIPLFHYSCSKNHTESFRRYLDPEYRHDTTQKYGIIVMERVHSKLQEKLDLTTSEKYVLFIQIVLTFVCIRKYYPRFGHNDLHIGNVLIRESTSVGYTHYDYGIYQFYLPNIGYQIVISDFGLSSLDSPISNLGLDSPISDLDLSSSDSSIYSSSNDDDNIMNIYTFFFKTPHEERNFRKVLFSSEFEEYTVPKDNIVLKFTL